MDEEAILDSGGSDRPPRGGGRSHPRCSLASDICAMVSEKAFASLKAPPLGVNPPHTPVPFARELETAYLPSIPRSAAGGGAGAFVPLRPQPLKERRIMADSPVLHARSGASK